MSRKTIITLAASAIIGMGCLAMVSTDAFARGGRAGAGVGHAGVGVGHHGVGVGARGVGVAGAPVRRGVAVGVGAAAVGAYARCGYSPYPPCY
jgi:hypothetical protein